jgi:hypothetical protein
MNGKFPRTLLTLLPFVFALAFVGCGDDGDSTTNPPLDNPGDDPVVDTTPPNVPTGLFVRHVNGSLRVHWDENSEPDLAGYKLQRSLDRGQTWADVSPTVLTENTVNDTYAGSVEYRVLAEDTSENQSAYTNPPYWYVAGHKSGGKGGIHDEVQKF